MILNTLLEYFSRYGYWVVFFGVMLENAGVPIPGETILLAAGFFAYLGHFNTAIVMVVAALGAMVGDNTGYVVGRKLGRAALERYGRRIGLTSALLSRFDRFFARNGNRTILFARFITGLRVFAALLAGAAKMEWRHFLFYNTAGAVIWAIVITLVGYFFGKSWDLLEKWVRGAGLIALIVVVIALIIMAIRKRRQPRAPEGSADE
ncbi:MAG TPA: DedA family protein [Blastocatellia bacterium]|nr:DedA family protein [Blastocatellia bacterium]